MHAGQGQIKVRQSWRTWEVWEPLYACRAGADQGEAELGAWEVWEPLYACRAGADQGEAELEDLGSVGATLCMQGRGRSR